MPLNIIQLLNTNSSRVIIYFDAGSCGAQDGSCSYVLKFLNTVGRLCGSLACCSSVHIAGWNDLNTVNLQCCCISAATTRQHSFYYKDKRQYGAPVTKALLDHDSDLS